MDIPEPIENLKRLAKWGLIISYFPTLLWPMEIAVLGFMKIPEENLPSLAVALIVLGLFIEFLRWRDRRRREAAARSEAQSWLIERQNEFSEVSSALTDVAVNLPPGSSLERIRPAQEALDRVRKNLGLGDEKVVEMVILKLKKGGR